MSSGAQCDNCGTFLGSDDPSQWQSRPWVFTLTLSDVAYGERHFCGPSCCAQWCEGVATRQSSGHGATPAENDFPRWPSYKRPLRWEDTFDDRVIDAIRKYTRAHGGL